MESSSDESEDESLFPPRRHTLATEVSPVRRRVRRRLGSGVPEKRARLGPGPGSPGGGDAEPDADFPEHELPCDTEVAFMTLRSQFPGRHLEEMRATPPLVLLSQLYAIVASRAVVDRELDDLRLRNVLRVIRLPGGSERDRGILHSVDLEAAVRRARGAARDQKERAVFDHFLEKVLPNCPDTSITEAALHMDSDEDRATVLVRAGFLTMRDTHLYNFGAPNIGALLKNRREGNKEVLRIVSSKQYKEILLKDLEVKRLRRSKFDTQFHIRDLVGSGQLEVVDTSVGTLLRIVTH